MKIKTTLLSFLLLFLFSCDKEKVTNEEPIAEDPKEDPIAEDETKPVLTISGFTDIIETTTPISISIVDESMVETKIMHGDEEIAASTEKQFEVSVNPYGIPVGSTDFVVVSTDANGNETSETYTVEIKHLLMIYGHSEQASQNEAQQWLFFNDLNGKELAVVEPIVGDTKIYTDEIVLEDRILYSFVNYQVWEPFVDSSYKNLFVTTYKIPLGKTKPLVNYDPYEEPANTLEVKLNDVPFVNFSPDYYAHGYRYNTTSYDGDDLQTTLIMKHDASRPICIRTNRWGGSTPKFDGKKENYKHLFITPEVGDTNVVIEADQLIHAENTIKLDIPTQDPGSLFVDRSAYATLDDYKANKYTGIYDKDSSNETEMVDYVDLPMFPIFEYYHNSVSYSRDGVYFSINGPDSNFDLSMPNWMASVHTTDTTIELTADNPDVDYYSMSLYKNEYEGNYSKAIHWNFNVFGEDGSVKTLPRLALPELITDAIGEAYFQTTDDLEINYLSAVDYEKYSSYDETIEWFAFGKNAPDGSENKRRQITFPTTNESGKSNLKKRPLDLDALHRFGMDAKGQINKRR